MPAPPLNAIRAFEAAARTGSFAAAARELAVTPAAIGQQVRRLEAFWGRRLFVREAGRLSLTEAGLTAYPPLGEAIAGISRLSDRMQGHAPRSRLVLSAPHSVAETWLPARLAVWRAAHPAAPLSLRVEEDPVDLAEGGIHARLFYGSGLYAEYRVERLFQDRFVMVAASTMAEACRYDGAAVPDDALIHTDWGAGFASGPDLPRLFGPERQIDMAAGWRVPTSSLALAAARAGLGAALIPERMAQPWIADGSLRRLDAPDAPMRSPYALAMPHSLSKNRAISALLDALRGPPAPG